MYANLTAFSIAPLAVPAGENQGKLLISFLAHNPAMSPFIGTYLKVSANLSYMYLYVLSNTANDEDDTGAKKLITLSVI